MMAYEFIGNCEPPKNPTRRDADAFLSVLHHDVPDVSQPR